MPSRKLKVGVIGAGFIAQQSHLPAYIDNPRCEVMGVADLDRGRLKEVNERFGIRGLYDTAEGLLKDGPDAVSVCLPTRFHADVAIQAMERGAHVLVEKPISLTLDEADAMIRASRRHDRKLMVGFNYRFISSHRMATDMLRRGKIGRPALFHAQFASMGPYERFDEAKDSFYFDPDAGGGVLFDSGVHLVDLARHYMGEVKRVRAALGTYKEGVDVEDTAALTLEFESGAVGHVTAMWTQLPSWSAMGKEGFVKVVGSEGKLTSDLFGPSVRYYHNRKRICKLKGELELSPRKMDPKEPFEALAQSWSDEVDAFVDAVRHDRQVPVTAEDGRRVLELITEAYRDGGRLTDAQVEARRAGNSDSDGDAVETPRPDALVEAHEAKAAGDAGGGVMP